MVILLSDILLLDFDNTDNLDTIVHHNNEEEGEFYPNLTRDLQILHVPPTRDLQILHVPPTRDL